MRNKLKKSPEDYKIFSFRCDDSTKNRLAEDIESTRSSLNNRLKPNEGLWRKNDVIVEAIRIGLPLLKKQRGVKN